MQNVNVYGPPITSVLGGALVGALSPPLLPVGIGLCLLALFWQQRSASRFRWIQTPDLRKVPAERRPVLVLPLSYVRGKPIPDFVRISGDLETDLAELAERKRRQTLDQKEDPDQRIQFWSWEQPLRAIRHHVCQAGPLRRLILLASAESITQVKTFRSDVLQQYPALKEVQCDLFLQGSWSLGDLDILGAGDLKRQNGFDFENFDRLTVAFQKLMKLLTHEGVKEGEVQIDLTAGQKPMSVVAAAVTFFSDVSNQYVATNPRHEEDDCWEYDVWGYDFREVRRADG